MKDLKKLSLVALCSLSLGGLASCGTGSSLKKIGILEYITQDALEQCRNGFVQALKDGGYEEGKNITIDYQNPEAESSNNTTMASKLARESDLVFGIATPSATALKSAVSDTGRNIPILYSAVTDPVSAGLIKSVTDHGNVLGTSDAGPTEKNIEIFTHFTDIKKIGIIYSIGETNSIVQKNEAEAACSKFGLTLVDGGFGQKNELASVLNGLIGKGIQGLFVPTDNAVAASMASIKDTLIDNKIVTVCADKAETANGGSLGYSVDYTDLGKTTGEMAVRLLNGEDINSIPCSLSSSFPLSVNDTFFSSTGITLPDDIPQNATLD